MSTSSTLTDSLVLLVFILAVHSCDSITEPDTITPEKFMQSDYYILPGASVIIDLESVIDQSFLNGTLSISEKPKRGTLSYVTTSLLKYKPGREFQEGEDHFILSVVNHGKIVAKGTMTIKMKNSAAEFSCGLVPVEDKIKLKAGSSSVSTKILDNDWLCDIDKSNVTISIQTQPNFGQALIDNESIIYTPAAEYKDRDELIYKVTYSTGEIVSYGLLSFHDYGEVTIQKIPNRHVTSLFFVDENTGFLSTRLGLYKTTDGGNNWDVLVPDLDCQGVFFLNEKNGFAIYSSERLNTSDRLAITKDGGATWKEVPPLFGQPQFGSRVRSIVFTSETTGFVVETSEGEVGLFGSSPTIGVGKTVDGGVTWKAVSGEEASSLAGYIDIQFINHTTGYATLSDRIFVTKDAGETWTDLLDPGQWRDEFHYYQLIDHVQVTEKNKLFVVLSEDNTSIITSQDGSEWRPVAHFLSDIFSIGFSPSAEVGFALVRDDAAPQNNNSDPKLQPMSIVKTVDKGETWVKQEMDEVLYGSRGRMYIPSNDVAYFLCYDRIIKYSNK